MQTLTETQQATLDFIRAFIRENGMAPTTQEIASGMGWRSPNNAHEKLVALQKKGYLTMKPGTNRGLVLTGSNSLDIPDVQDEVYWFDGVFQHLKYERDVYKVIQAAGLKGSKKSWS